MKPQIVLIDNFDSFTYNLVDEFRALGCGVTVYRNTVPCDYVESALAGFPNPVVVLSPGPGVPSNAGAMPELITRLRGKTPMIGICLGHQALVEAYGGRIGPAAEIVHGKGSPMTYRKHPVFEGLPNPFTAARYHSLTATEVPETLDVIAETVGVTMAVVNDRDKTVGFQFHPESILTNHGARLLHNTLNWITARKGE